MKYKKIISTILTMCVILTITYTSSTVFADSNIAVYYEGNRLEFDVQPEIIGNYTMVPARGVFEAMGAKVKWDENSNTVTVKKKKKSISMVIGENITDQDGNIIETDAVPALINDRTLISLRLVTEFLGANVEWDEYSNSVYITDKEKVVDDTWKENTGNIDLSLFKTENGNGVTINENTVEITKGGDFEVTGSTTNGMILVNTDDRVKLRLSGTDITNPNGPAIFFENVDKGFITLTENTTNTLTDGSVSNYPDAKAALFSDDDLEIKGNGILIVNANYNHGIASDKDIKIESGNITINSTINDGIKANSSVEILDGDINITSKGDGIQSDLWNVIIDGGNINITTTGEINSNDSNENFGGHNQGESAVGKNQQFYEENNGGKPSLEQQNSSRNKMISEVLGGIDITEFKEKSLDEIEQLITDMVSDGTLSLENIAIGNQSINSNTDAETQKSQSSKGIKADEDIYINGGNIIVNSTDHSVHSGDIIEVNDGNIEINSSSGKAFSAHGNLTINSGDINIIYATEGIESKAILTINGGNIYANVIDDGLNAGGTNSNQGGFGPGTDIIMSQERLISTIAQIIIRENNRNNQVNLMKPSGDINNQNTQAGNISQDEQMANKPGRPENSSNAQIPDRDFDGGFGMGNVAENGHNIVINNGYIVISSKGDGIDSNGRLEINGGTILINGPSTGGDTALDSDGKMLINGGVVVGVSSIQMLEVPSDESAQNIIIATLDSSVDAGTIINVEDEDGNSILTFKAEKVFQGLIFSSDNIKTGKSYTVSTGGTVSDSITADDGLYNNQVKYNNGAILGSMEITSKITRIGNANSGNFGGNGRFGGRVEENNNQTTEVDEQSTQIKNQNTNNEQTRNEMRNDMNIKDINRKDKLSESNFKIPVTENLIEMILFS